ncbi:hypothetical protein ACLESD_24900 [Pyxidicoccus sp. 3LFB2]
MKRPPSEFRLPLVSLLKRGKPPRYVTKTGPGLKLEAARDAAARAAASEWREGEPIYAYPTSYTVMQGGQLELCVSQDLSRTAAFRVYVHGIYQPDWGRVPYVVEGHRGGGRGLEPRGPPPAPGAAGAPPTGAGG